MERWTRFINWCQQPSKIKIRTYNPRNLIVLITTFIILAYSGTLVAQRAIFPPYIYLTPEDIETLTITTDTTLTKDYFNTTIVIAADGVTLDGDGHMIIGPWLYGSDIYNMTIGVSLEGRTGVTIKNCCVTGFSYGFFLNGSDGNTLQGNIAYDNNDGFFFLESDGNSFEANTANNNTYMGFTFLDSSKNSFEANTANNNGHFGFWSDYTHSDTFRDNAANGNNRGFYFTDSSGNTIQGNTANDNINGFVLERSDGNSFEANMANNNSHSGFHLGLSSNNTLTGNTISSNNEYGICYGTTDEGSPNNRIYHNNFINNLQHVNILNTVNTWDDGYPSGGNYWSDYTEVDGDGDGIGDTSYVINQNNMDRYPLMTPISVLDTGTNGGEEN